MPQDDALLTLKEVQRYYAPYTKAHIYTLMKEGKFPNRVAIGPNRVVWRESELKAWLAGRMSAQQEAGQGAAAKAS